MIADGCDGDERMVRRAATSVGVQGEVRPWSARHEVGRRSVFHELDGDGAADEACRDSAFEEEPHGCPPAIAVVERPVVHVHSDEGVGLRSVETACVLHGVVQRLRSMLQSVRYAGAKVLRYLPCQVGSQVLPDDVTAERQWQARFGEPPFAEVGDEVEAAFRERQLTLMDEQSQVDLSIRDAILDLIEWGRDWLKIGLVEA